MSPRESAARWVFEGRDLLWSQAHDERWTLPIGWGAVAVVGPTAGGYGLWYVRSGRMTTISTMTTDVPLEVAIEEAEAAARDDQRTLVLARRGAAWRRKPATATQLKRLRALGVDREPPPDRGEAAAWLAAYAATLIDEREERAA